MDLRAKLRELRELRDEGLLDDAEFAEMKSACIRQHREVKAAQCAAQVATAEATVATAEAKATVATAEATVASATQASTLQALQPAPTTTTAMNTRARTCCHAPASSERPTCCGPVWGKKRTVV